VSNWEPLDNTFEIQAFKHPKVMDAAHTGRPKKAQKTNAHSLVSVY